MNEITDIYDRLGENYLTSMYTASKWTQYVDKTEQDFVLRAWGLARKSTNQHERILDIGVGPGRWAELFCRQGFQSVYGVDISPEMARVAKRRVDNPSFKAIVGDAENLPFADNSFDRVFCWRSFKYIPHPQLAIQEMRRVLKPGGTALIEVTNASLYNRILQGIARLTARFPINISIHSRWHYFAKTNFYTKRAIENFMANQGLTIIKTYYLFSLPSIPLPAGYRFLKFADRVISKFLPRALFARSWIIIMARPEK